MPAGRCHRCNVVYGWHRVKTVSIVEMVCPACAFPLWPAGSDVLGMQREKAKVATKVLDLDGLFSKDSGVDYPLVDLADRSRYPFVDRLPPIILKRRGL